MTVINESVNGAKVAIGENSFKELDRRQQARIRARARELLYPYKGETPEEEHERVDVTQGMYFAQMSTVSPESTEPSSDD